MDVKTKLGGLFQSLQPGDLLIIPLKSPLSQEQLTAYSAVLRLGAGGELFISCPNGDKAISKPYCHNPIHWDSGVGAMLDGGGDVLPWYSDDIQVEREAATAVASEYQRVPRVEQARLSATDEDFKTFLSSSEFPVLRGIAQNGESGEFSQQLSLVLDQLGLKHNPQQLAALIYFFETNFAKRIVQVGIAEVSAAAGAQQEDAAPKGCTIH